MVATAPDERAQARVEAGPLAHAAGVIVVGAVVALDPAGWYPFGPAKWWVVSTSIAAAAAVWWWRGERLQLPRRVVVGWIVLLAWLGLAAALGRDPLYAWTGTPERRLGWLAWVLFACCAAVGSSLTGRVQLVRWTRWVTVAAVWCGGYALVERWWGAPVAWGAATSRLGGPFGSAAYLGAALCLLVPITAGVALDRAEQPGWRAAGAFGVATGVVALVGSGTRGAWLGVVLAVGALVIAGRRPSRRTWAAAGALAVVALAVVGTRLDDVVDRSTPVASRIDEWSMAGRAVVERPLLGAGPEGYRTVVADVVSADYERTYGREVLPDRAHDGVLDVAVTGGLPAMVAHLALVAWALGAAWRALRERDARRVGLGVAVIAYVAQQAFLFPLAELDPVLWLAAGALLTTGNGLHTPPARHRRRWPAVAAACGALALFATGALGVAADRAAADATSRAGDAATVAARRAVSLRPDVLRYRLLDAAVNRATGTLAGVDAAIAAADRGVALSPRDPIARLTAAELRLDRARITGDDDDVARALAAWRRLAADDPNCRACQFGLGAAAALAGDAALAEQAWIAAAALSRPGDERATIALAALRARSGS